MPAWAMCTEQDADTGELCALAPPADLRAYAWRHARLPPPPSLRIYELHVGIALADEAVGTWDAAAASVLPRVAAAGYTAVLLLGVLEHGYYASFGYLVTSYLAPSSRFGPPAALQRFIDTAHGLGLQVVLRTAPQPRPLAPHAARALSR